MVRRAELISETTQDSERVLGIARVDDRKPPHDSQGHNRALERMWMDIRHARWAWPLNQNDRAMRATREFRSLSE